MVKAMGVTVYYVHMGNQTSVFWRRVNTFVLWKMKIFHVNLNLDRPQVLHIKKVHGISGSCSCAGETVTLTGKKPVFTSIVILNVSLGD